MRHTKTGEQANAPGFSMGVFSAGQSHPNGPGNNVRTSCFGVGLVANGCRIAIARATAGRHLAWFIVPRFGRLAPESNLPGFLDLFT